MGLDSKNALPLPAPTETTITGTPSELTASEISIPGDEQSSYSIPDDGTPVTIRTRGHRANKSQTSLLIEYFEGGRSTTMGDGSTSERKPSVRVRLTPSRKGKGDHIQVTESKGSRKASVTRRIPLDQGPSSRDIDFHEGDDDMNSYASATEESNVSRNPIDIEIDRGHRRRRPASPLIPNESYQTVNASEISAIPTDSFLDGSGPDYKNSPNPYRGEAHAAGSVTNTKSRSAAKERVKNAEKQKEKSDRKRRTKSRTSNVSEQIPDEARSSRHRSSRGHQESMVSAADSSVLSSNLSPNHRSLDAHSMRSGTSKSSINNPKLLETVEDAIRRLILPELSALKREQSKRETRRDSFASTGTSVSKDDLTTPDRRRSSGQRSVSTQDGSRKDRRNREARHDYAESSLLSSRDSVQDDYEYHDDGPTTPKRGDLVKAAAAGAALSTGLSILDDEMLLEDRTRDRRRKRTDSARSRSLGRDRYAEEREDEPWTPAPPMPLMSEINPSEVTRASILSADASVLTDRPHSATEESIHEVSRGMADAATIPIPGKTPDNLQVSLGTSHANVSHGDLKALPRGKKSEVAEEYETDEYGHKVLMDYRDGHVDDEARDFSDPGDYPDRSFEEEYYNTQDVPSPLKYVPYQAGARGLSPIPSVSGYTDGASEVYHPRHSMSVHSAASNPYPSPEKSLERGAQGSNESMNSVPSNMRSRAFDQFSADERSAKGSGIDYRNSTFTEDSELGQAASTQEVRGVGVSPRIIHPPFAVESAVASLIDGSMLEQSVMTSGSGYGQRDSTISYDRRTQSSRGQSPEKRSIEGTREFQEERHATPGSRSQEQSQNFSEYDIDEFGRKVTRSKYRQSPTASEAAITAGAVGAAAAALKAAQERNQDIEEDTENWVGAGVGRNKSFKERTMEGWEPRNTPSHSVDRFSYDEPKMGASYMPDHEDPMPEIGYVDDAATNPSVVDERLDGEYGDQWGRATPTQQSISDFGQVINSEGTPKASHELGLTEVAGAAALTAAVGMAAAHSREPSQDEWQRTSDDRKRDTLLTNPYEDASPVANPALNDNLLGARGLDASYGYNESPSFGHKYDEGYMSNRSPDVEPKGKAVGLGGPSKAGGEEDPFYVPKDSRQLSGMSQGMSSPFYDASTGAGIDRIENKDIVALMQHLMVRDAQRSARDTEIVALLMNAALEMRNSFREMKELIQDTGDDVIFAGTENTEKLQKAINGPRPYPGTATRSIQSSQPGTMNEAESKKRNLWKRALAGLGAKGTSDLTRIEDMLMQLLGEVDVLKTQTAQPGQPVSSGAASGPASGLPSGPVSGPRSGSAQSFENLQPEGQYEQDHGYEPEGVSTASYASRSGHLSLPPSRGQTARSVSERKASDNRVSTVQEDEDEYNYDHPSPMTERVDPAYLTAEQTQRGFSVPPDSPSQHASLSQQALSADNTPRTEKGKKSGWLPKISRWSESTATSVGRVLRGNGKKESKQDDQPPPSRSGSSLASYGHGYEHDPYGEDHLHSGFSEPNLGTTTNEPADVQAQPKAAGISPEDPKYRAHRNSLNLQHPQPRPGPTERFRTALEYSAQEYMDPLTPRSADWNASVTSIDRLPNTQRYSQASSTAPRECENWATSPGGQSGPPRPPKEPMDRQGGVTPSKARISKLAAKGSPLQYHNQTYDDGYDYTSPTGSPKPENRNLNTALGVSRRPSGPRAMTPKSPEEEAAREERRRKRGM